MPHKWYRTPIATSNETLHVDTFNAALLGVSVVEIGEASGHDEEIDKESLNMFKSLGNESRIGKKVRFGHPEMSADPLPMFAGRLREFRIVDDRVVGDVFFDESAMRAPDNMVDRVMTRARSDPDSFGMSVVFTGRSKTRINEDGTAQTDDDGNDLLPLVRPTSLLAVDFVDSPAATSGLFSMESFYGTNVILSAEASQVLDDVLSREDAEERIMGFLKTYFGNRNRREKEKVMPSAKIGDLGRQREVTDQKDYRAISARDQVSSFVASKIESLEATPGVKNTEGLIEALCFLATLGIFGDKNKEDKELVSVCPSMYDVADHCEWRDSEMYEVAIDMFEVRDPFSVVLDAIGNAPPFLAVKGRFAHLSRKNGGNQLEQTAPRGAGIHPSEIGFDPERPFSSMNAASQELVRTMSKGKITDDRSYLENNPVTFALPQ